jgi:predicted AAA+ superfamily ATPase
LGLPRRHDPELFLREFGSSKLFIDEAQYAPALFPSLKRKADLFKRSHQNKSQIIVRITGSNQPIPIGENEFSLFLE